MATELALWATILEVVDETDGSGKGSLRDGFPREMQLYCAPKSTATIDPEKNRLSRLAVQRRSSGGARA
jgi:hypothetical protein